MPMRPLILHGHKKPLTCVKYNFDGDLLFSAAKESSPSVWYTHNGERLGTLEGHTGVVWSLDISRLTDYVITASGDFTLILFTLPNGQVRRRMNLESPAKCVEFSEGDEMFLAVSDAFSTKPSKVFVFTMKDVLAQNENLSEKELSRGTENCHTYCWDCEEVKQRKGRLVIATWCPLNEGIITSDELGTIRIHDVKTGVVLKKYTDLHSAKVNSFVWNVDRTLLLSASSDETAALIKIDFVENVDSDAQNEEKKEGSFELSVLKRYKSSVPVNAAVMSPIKEHVLLAGGQEAMQVTTTSARVGKFETKFFHAVFGDEWGSVKGHFGPVNALAIHPQGTGFASGSEDGYVRLHTFDKDYYSMHSEMDDLTDLERQAKQ